MTRGLVFIVPLLMALALPIHAAGSEKRAFRADTPERFELLVSGIRQEMAPGGRYEFLSDSDREMVNRTLDTMGELIEQSGSVDAMQPEDQVTLFTEQEKVNGILVRNSDDRLVCTYVAPVGTHIPMTKCHTVRELRMSLQNYQRQMPDWSLTHRYPGNSQYDTLHVD